MQYVRCHQCDANSRVRDLEKIGGRWLFYCPICHISTEVNIEDFAIPMGTTVRFGEKPDEVGTIQGILPHSSHLLSLLTYKIRCENPMPYTIEVRADKLTVLEPSWKKLVRTDYGIQRVCHYPRNQEYGNAPCYNCADRTKCNADIFDTLAMYEDSNLSPEAVGQIATVLRQKNWSIADLEKL